MQHSLIGYRRTGSGILGDSWGLASGMLYDAYQAQQDLLAPFRKADADEAMKLIDDAGYDNLHLTFYKNMDIGNDGVWDVWQIEGPSMLWYFRGAPHVHAFVNVAMHADAPLSVERRGTDVLPRPPLHGARWRRRRQEHRTPTSRWRMRWTNWPTSSRTPSASSRSISPNDERATLASCVE